MHVSRQTQLQQQPDNKEPPYMNVTLHLMIRFVNIHVFN